MFPRCPARRCFLPSLAGVDELLPGQLRALLQEVVDVPEDEVIATQYQILGFRLDRVWTMFLRKYLASSIGSILLLKLTVPSKPKTF